jgi:hypothetical protein
LTENALPGIIVHLFASHKHDKGGFILKLKFPGIKEN